MQTVRLNYPELLEWGIVERSAHLSNCAQFICGLISEFNGAAREYGRVLSERDATEEKFNRLSAKYKNMESCQKCAVLETRLQMQNSKLKAISNIFDQISTDNQQDGDTQSKLEQAHGIFSQMDEDDDVLFLNIPEGLQTPEKAKPPSNRERTPVKSAFSACTPQKRLASSRKSEDSFGEIEDTFVDQSSPILKKIKTMKRSLSNENTAGKKSPLKNVTNSNEEPDAFLKKIESSNSKNKRDHIFEDPNPKPKSQKYDENRFQFNVSTSIVDRPTAESKGKKLKQSRLHLTKIKPKVDISQTDIFCGGIRDHSGHSKQENITNKNSQSTMFEANDEMSSNDVIYESPSCLIKAKKNNPELLRKEPNEQKSHSPFKIKIAMTSEDDDTMCCFPKNSFRVEKRTPKKPTKSTSPNKLNILYSDKEQPYKEDPVRKKAEKNKLQGWSCEKCGDFYKTAFKGNEDLINKKINECSKHRGKFNPERSKTPPGFWDMNMPLTLDTEEFNKRNNRT